MTRHRAPNGRFAKRPEYAQTHARLRREIFVGQFLEGVGQGVLVAVALALIVMVAT